jgi:hypothetical protein
LTETIGHELQHAVEVLSDPKVMDSRDLFHLFNRIGPTGVDRFETPAAVRAGLAVAREACHD